MRNQAIRVIHPSVVVINGETEALDIDTNVVALDEALITAEVTRLQAAYDSQAYSRSRATAYAALNQFEMQFDDAANSTTTWVDAINAIKAKYPKPS